MERTLAYLTGLEYRREKVERWNAYAKVRQDLFGIVDVVALKPPKPVLFIQVTPQKEYQNHVRKISQSAQHVASCIDIIRCGARFEIWAWAKHKVKRGGTAVRWDLRRYEGRWDEQTGELTFVDPGQPALDFGRGDKLPVS